MSGGINQDERGRCLVCGLLHPSISCADSKQLIMDDLITRSVDAATNAAIERCALIIEKYTVTDQALTNLTDIAAKIRGLKK